MGEYIEREKAIVEHGMWIEEKYETTSKRGRKIKNVKTRCPVCGKSNGRNKPNFCPNCGAKMDGGQHEIQK